MTPPRNVLAHSYIELTSTKFLQQLSDPKPGPSATILVPFGTANTTFSDTYKKFQHHRFCQYHPATPAGSTHLIGKNKV